MSVQVVQLFCNKHTYTHSRRTITNHVSNVLSTCPRNTFFAVNNRHYDEYSNWHNRLQMSVSSGHGKVLWQI